MSPIECPFEDDALTAVTTNRWPERVEPALREHVSGCAICTDIIAIAPLLAEDADVARQQANVPDAGLIWWRAQMRARAEAARTAVRPITVAQAVGFAAAVGLGIVVAVSSRVFRAGDSRPVTLYMATVSAILLIAFCAQQGDIALPTTPVGQIGFVAAIMFYAFALIAFFIAVSMIGPARSSLLSYAEPVASAGLGVAVLGEALTLTQIGGIILMVGALVGATMLKQSASG